MAKHQYGLVASLFNGKHVLLDPNPTMCNFRYLTDKEVKNKKLNLKMKFMWLETPVLTKVENGMKIVYVVIDDTPVYLMRLPNDGE